MTALSVKRLLPVFTLTALLWVSLLILATSSSAWAQQTPTPTQTVQPAAEGENSSFEVGLGPLIGILAALFVVTGGLALWVVRGKDSQIDVLEARITSEQRHSQQLEELNAKTEKLLKDQIEALKSQAGIEADGLVQPAALELPPDLKEQLSQILALQHEIRAARPQVEVSEPPSPEAIGEEHLHQGNAYFAAGNYAEALSEYESALELQPGNATTLMNRGVALSRLGRHREALVAFDRSLALRPAHVGTLANRSAALGRLGRYKESIQDCDQALAVDPDDAVTLVNRGIAHAALAHHKEALADYDRAVELGDLSSSLFYNLAIALKHLGRDSKANDSFNHAETLADDDAQSNYNAACALSVLERGDEAIARLEHALELDASYLRGMAQRDPDLENIRDEPRFRKLLGEAVPADEGESEPESSDKDGESPAD